MNPENSKEELTRELQKLKEELAELHAVQHIHRHTEEGLQAIERQLAGVIHSAMDAIITVDQDQIIVIFNAAAEVMFGCSAYEVIGTSVNRFIPLRFRDAHQDHIQRFGHAHATNRRMGALGSISGLRSNGEEFPIEASISHVEVSGKQLFTVVLRDISDRQRAEEQIARLGRVLDESLNEIFLFHGETLKFVQVNRGARENLGYTMEEFLKMTPVSLKPEFTDETFDQLIQPLRAGTVPKIEFRTKHRRKNGTCYPVEIHLQLVGPKDNMIFVAIVLDLNERLQAEMVLQETQRTLATLMKNLPGMVYRCKNDRGWPMEFVSEGCEQLTGYTAHELIGNHNLSYGRDIIVPEDRDRVWKEVQVALKHQKSYQITYRIKTANGVNKWMWEQGAGVFSSDGVPFFLEGYVFDMTQEKMLEDRLRKTERLAELGTLSSGMAHEIGTPMNVILGRAEYLMRKTTDETTKKGLNTIVTQVERITKIMNQLLSFARKRPVERRPINLKKIIESIYDMLHDRLVTHNIEAEIKLKASIPEVFADPDQLSQVFLNLVMNACHAMSQGGKLCATLTPSDTYVCVSISDTGVGIPERNVSRLFDPFFTTKPVGEGTGLGLTVVHGIIQEHDGRIEVESTEGKGSTFHVFLPIYDQGRGANDAV